MNDIERNGDGTIPGASVHEVRCAIDAEVLRRAIYRCRQVMRDLLLPDQQQDELVLANALEQRLGSTDDPVTCDENERGFVTLWNAAPAERLNGTQRMALQFYRDGRYGSAQLASEVIGADNGMAWSLIRHLQATNDPERAYHQLERTFARVCALGESMRHNLNRAIGSEDAQAPQDELREPLGTQRSELG